RRRFRSPATAPQPGREARRHRRRRRANNRRAFRRAISALPQKWFPRVQAIHSLGRRFGGILFRRGGNVFRWLRISSGNESRPGFPGLGRVLRRFAGNRWDANEVVATGALNFASGKLFVTLQVLLALRAGEFEF